MNGPVSAASNRPTLIFGNWKANPSTAQQAQNLAVDTAGRLHRVLKDDTVGRYRNVQVGVFVPNMYLPVIGHHMVFMPYDDSRKAKWSDPLLLGVQTLSNDVSPSMITSCFEALRRQPMVLVGHAEQRERGETNKMVNEKIHAAQEHGIRPVLCIGERHTQREANQTTAPLTLQLSKSLSEIDPDAFIQAGTVIAYQAGQLVGAETTLAPAIIGGTHAHIRSIILSMFGHDVANKTPIIYAGYTDLEDAPAILAQEDVDGLLLEKPSLDADEFIEFVKAVPA